MIRRSPRCYYVEIGPLVLEKILITTYERGGHLGHATFVPTTHRGSTQNWPGIGQAVSENGLNILDDAGRQALTDDGRRSMDIP